MTPLRSIVLAALIAMQFLAGGIESMGGVVCIGRGGHIAIERPHIPGGCAAPAEPVCCHQDRHESSDDHPVPFQPDCTDVELIAIDAPRPSATEILPLTLRSTIFFAANVPAIGCGLSCGVRPAPHPPDPPGPAPGLAIVRRTVLQL